MINKKFLLTILGNPASGDTLQQALSKFNQNFSNLDNIIEDVTGYVDARLFLVGSNPLNQDVEMNAALQYAVNNNKVLLLPPYKVKVNSLRPNLHSSTNPLAPAFSADRIVIKGHGQGISIIEKIASGTSDALVYIGKSPSDGIRFDVTMEGFTIDGLNLSTYSGIEILDVWRGRLQDIEIKNCNFGHQTLGCIYMLFTSVNVHDCNYGFSADRLIDSVFRPLIGPSNIHTHISCSYVENRKRGGIFDWGASLIMISCNIEYNGADPIYNATPNINLGDADHGGLYLGDNVSFAVQGTVLTGLVMIGCWFENNHGREQIRLGAGAHSIQSTHFIVPPDYTTYGININAGRLSITNNTVFAAAFTNGNVKDESSTLDRCKIDATCSLYNVFVDTSKWILEKKPGIGALTRLGEVVSVPSDLFPNKIVPWSATIVDNSGGCFDYGTNTRMTVPANVSRVRVSAGLTFSSNGSGIRQVSIKKNGATVTSQSQPGLGFNAFSLTTPVVNVIAGDYFEVMVYQNSGSTLTLNLNDGDFFNLEIIG
jgi:hypothetical protein